MGCDPRSIERPAPRGELGPRRGQHGDGAGDRVGNEIAAVGPVTEQGGEKITGADLPAVGGEPVIVGSRRKSVPGINLERRKAISPAVWEFHFRPANFRRVFVNWKNSVERCHAGDDALDRGRGDHPPVA